MLSPVPAGGVGMDMVWSGPVDSGDSPTFELKAARLAESPACVGVPFRRTRGPPWASGSGTENLAGRALGLALLEDVASGCVRVSRPGLVGLGLPLGLLHCIDSFQTRDFFF